jgi:alpha-tubulin suppressor-like RCC1 family protein
MGKLGLPEKRQDPKNIRDYHPTNYADKAMFGKVTGPLKEKKIVQVACGFHHTLCLTANGQLFAWGKGKEGALGVGDWENRTEPTLVKGVSNIKKICCGSDFSMVLTNDGKIYSWGRNNYGQLGNQGKQQNKENLPIQINLPSEVQVVDISCGEEHAALLTAEGHVYTWGFGHDGQLGHSAKTHLTAPKKIEDFPYKAKKVVCGGGHTAIITEQGDLYLFGRGRDGQLGRGDVIESVAVSRYSPTKVLNLYKRIQK